MKTTYRQVIRFNNVGFTWLGNNSGETKLSVAVTKMLKRAEAVIKVYREKVEDFSYNTCMASDGKRASDPPEGVVLRQNGELCFTKEGSVALVRFQRALMEEEVEIQPYFVVSPNPSEGLSFDEEVAFEGFVFPAEE